MSESDRPMPKMARTSARAWVARQLMAQGNLCPVCSKHIDLKVKAEGVVDHDHTTGEVRGVLHRSCNAALGKVDQAAGRWGAKSMLYVDIVAFLKNMLAYYAKPGLGIIYFAHKTIDEKKDAINLKARTRRAELKAKQSLAIKARSTRKE